MLFKLQLKFSCRIYLTFLVFYFILDCSFSNLDRRFQFNKDAMNISNTSTDQGLLRSRESSLMQSITAVYLIT